MMTYKLKTEQRPGYLYFHVEGETSYDTGLALWREIGEKCNELACKSILVEESLTGQVSLEEMIRITSQFRNFGLSGKKIAFIDRVISHDKGNELGEIIARDGGVDALIFKSLAEATNWLLIDDSN